MLSTVNTNPAIISSKSMQVEPKNVLRQHIMYYTAGYCAAIIQLPKLPFLLEHLQISKGLGRPLNYVSACITIAIHCAVTAKYDNKDVYTVLNLFHKCLDISILLMYFY